MSEKLPRRLWRLLNGKVFEIKASHVVGLVLLWFLLPLLFVLMPTRPENPLAPMQQNRAFDTACPDYHEGEGRYVYSAPVGDRAVIAFHPPAQAALAWQDLGELEVNPVFSPDGKQIAFSRITTRTITVATRDIATGTTTDVVTQRCLRMEPLKFSHDGNFLLIRRTDRAGGLALLVEYLSIDVRSTSIRQLPGTAVFGRRSNIVFLGDDHGANGGGIRESSLNTEETRLLCDGNQFVVAPDDSVLVVNRSDTDCFVYERQSGRETPLPGAGIVVELCGAGAVLRQSSEGYFCRSFQCLLRSIRFGRC